MPSITCSRGVRPYTSLQGGCCGSTTLPMGPLWKNMMPYIKQKYIKYYNASIAAPSHRHRQHTQKIR